MNVFAVMAAKVQKLLEKTSEGFSYSIPSDVDWSKPHVFVSNHRDIVLDAALMECCFFECGLKQPAALAGANLMTNDSMIKFCRLNNVFTMERGDGSKRAFYENLRLTSQRIREHIDNGTSVWVAQRNGRTKDGLDKTDPAVLKMLCLSGKDKLESLLELGVTPMSISYELEPCAYMKAREMMVRAQQGEYHKAPHEDEQSVITGVQQPKGHIHITFGRPLTREQFEGAEDPIQRAAEILDEQIWSNYKLWPNNYLAADILGLKRPDGSAFGREYYTAEDEHNFDFTKSYVFDEALWQWVMRIYAGPVASKLYGNESKQKLNMLSSAAQSQEAQKNNC
ncbi:MAG: 1-acyl-sn-glycerol-3-phosphate acyltransferase [Bacteroidales bacterium]|nr:1-acyl-sn-glycerol-3-phosphate acyltransferase [Bacteroidales bacterium]